MSGQEARSAARGQVGPDFHQRDEDNIDASREQPVATALPRCDTSTALACRSARGGDA